ncbi:MAG: isoprenylcysteine carboxylmethyltransferase family protein [Pseudomonadota bacterium]
MHLFNPGAEKKDSNLPEKQKKDAPNVRFPPPLVFLGFILLGRAGDTLFPLPTLQIAPELEWIGVGLIATGIAIVIVSLGLFSQAGENPEPWTESETIIARGPYRHSRNPMYLGMAMLMLGFAFWQDSAGTLFFLPFAVLAIDRFVIRAEEIYLTRRFGKPYTDYLKKVRRWL